MKKESCDDVIASEKLLRDDSFFIFMQGLRQCVDVVFYSIMNHSINVQALIEFNKNVLIDVSIKEEEKKAHLRRCS
jgi:hypothetical protein